MPPPIGLVIIGRNEGERLRRCLESARGRAAHSVYVDSGSTDGSVEMSRSMGVEVVALDTTVPFTAARARNAGVQRLLALAPATPYVQFVDGDCEIDPAWWDVAVRRLDERPELAAVCGRRRERFRDASRYNRMCDLEWDTPVGDANECGGDAMMRVTHFQAVGGFDPTLIAGEEPDLCVRFRQQGWKIERIGAEMTLHDAAMTRFNQWWRREKRSGYAFAEGAHRFGHLPERFRVREVWRNYFYGLILPVLAIAPAWFTNGWTLLLLPTIYPIHWVRHYRQCRRRKHHTPADARLYTTLCLIAKFPQTAGQLKFVAGRLTNRPSKLIEYKGAAAPALKPDASRDAGNSNDDHPSASRATAPAPVTRA